MKRTVAAVALIGLAAMAQQAFAGPQSAGFGGPIFRDPVATEDWTDPSGSFSFEKPTNWKNVDQASAPGAATLQIVAGNSKAECWFTRSPSAVTASLTPSELIRVRSEPLSADLWAKVGAGQHLLPGPVIVRETSVQTIGAWPVQIAWFTASPSDVLGVLHSRPGLDIWAFCAAKRKHNDDDLLLQVALSVTTPRDAGWLRLLTSQASFTAVP